MELVARVGKHVYTKNGVLTDLKSFGTIQLGYGIKKLDGRYFQHSTVLLIFELTLFRAHYANSWGRFCLPLFFVIHGYDLNVGIGRKINPPGDDVMWIPYGFLRLEFDVMWIPLFMFCSLLESFVLH
ncbi:hypothetical protein JRO89_XS04G0025700 [Xanthoceras sorbifolium]|uniref:Uncharacterized protein n=1 Tax=Xanthoceras sorbifolium TaxID=99658 RepID=A0ABQ8I3W5_9ROSI|nr:hypothetical protein JRO89_XS04G0025700 [Xanthoceras sorbifolium]